MTQNELIKLKELIDNAESSIKSAKKIIKAIAEGKEIELPVDSSPAINDEPDGTVILGVFTGQNMLGDDTKTYPVPANYASKSKLIPGDKLKLTITETGQFIYKQIGPTERKQIRGRLTYDAGQYKVLTEEGTFNVLLASVTYFKASEHDDVVITVPALQESAWAAIENIVPKDSQDHFEVVSGEVPQITSDIENEKYTI